MNAKTNTAGAVPPSGSLEPTGAVAALRHPTLSSRGRWMVAMPPLVMLAMGASISHFVITAISSNPALNGLIFVVMGWGSWTMFGHVHRIYTEERVFHSGMAWLREGTAGGQQNPRHGEDAQVVGMLERLNKLGLGHEVHVHTSAVEPELEALDHYFVKKQELSQYLVGLMVALGLLGTFFGLLETLVQTSSLIGTIAKSSSGGGADMEQEFSKIVSGLQGPLTAMGTAFSASMFGLVGSIMLGFQMVAVRKTASEFIELVRSEVLSLAEGSKLSAQVEITERFLATLLHDILLQHKETTASLARAAGQISVLVPEVKAAIAATAHLTKRVESQEAVLERVTNTVGSVAPVLPILGALAESSHEVLEVNRRAGDRVAQMLSYLPTQERLLGEVKGAMSKVEALSETVAALSHRTDVLGTTIREQSTIVRRMDATLWNTEKQALLDAVDPPAGAPARRGQGNALKDGR